MLKLVLTDFTSAAAVIPGNIITGGPMMIPGDMAYA